MLVLLPFTEWLRNFYLGLVRQTITSRRLLPDKDISFLIDCGDNFDEWFTHMLKLEMLSNLKKIHILINVLVTGAYIVLYSFEVMANSIRNFLKQAYTLI